jgi:hypothetical protein
MQLWALAGVGVWGWQMQMRTEGNKGNEADHNLPKPIYRVAD